MTTGERIAAHLLKWRFAWLAAAVAVTALLAWPAAQVGVDNALEVWFPQQDPAYREYLRFQHDFGNDEIIAIAIHDDHGFINNAGLQRLELVSRRLSAVEHITRVTSIADFRQAWKDGLGGHFERMSQHPAARNRLISTDEKSALLIAELKTGADIDSLRPQIIADIRTALEDQTPYHLAGIGIIYDALNQLATRDSAVFLIAGYTVIVALLWLFLRRVLPVIATLVAAGISSVWLLGLYGLAGRDINMVTMVMPSLLLVICISMCVHIFHHVHTLSGTGTGARSRLIISGVGAMIVPCFFNIATSSAGFISLAASPMQVVHDLGLFTAAGLLIVFAIALLLCVLALGMQREPAAHREHSRIAVVGEHLTELAIRHPWRIIFAAVLLCLAAGTGIARITVYTNSLGYIVDNHPVPTDSRLIESSIGPYTPLEFVVRGDSVLQPDTVHAIQQWEQRALASGQVGWSHSIGTYIGDFPVATALDLLKHFSAVDGLWQRLVHEPDEVRVTFGIPIQSAQAIQHTITRLTSLARLPADVTVTASGYIPLYTRMMTLIVDTLGSSFIIAFVAVFAMLALLFRSLRMLLLSLPSNLLPVIMVLGLMGWAGIALDVATVTIAAIVLGLVVDDTVQFLYRYRTLHRHHPNREALRLTARGIGQSMVMTSVAISAGLSVLMLADVKSIVWFGLLVPCTMLFALLADLLLLPALIVLFDNSAAERP